MSLAGKEELQNVPAVSNERDTRIEESAVEIAINQTGFGKFSIKMTIVCSLIYLNMSVGVISTGFVLPAAACDLKMNILDKGFLSTIFFIGACLGAAVSGFLANIKGRKRTLLIVLFIQGISDLLISILSNYWIMLGLKFLSGFGSAGQQIVFTYLGECLPLKNRSVLLTFMEVFWVIGHAFASVAGLGIIPFTFRIETQYFLFRSWNLYILICSLPAFLLVICLTYFPETPKYLAERGSREKLLYVLITIYKQNIGKSGKEYMETLLNSGNNSLVELVYNNKKEVNGSNRKPLLKRQMFKQEFKQLRCIFIPPFLRNTIFSCFIAFTVTSSYYTLYLWLPEIFRRFSIFQNENSNFCAILKDNSSSFQNKNDCDIPIDKEVFINNLILCLSCFPTIIIVALLVKRWGIKILLVSCCILCMVVTIGLYFSNSYLQNLILLCLFMALSSTSMTLQFAYFVTIFPTNFRSSGVLVTGLIVRIGGLFGNFSFSFLKDYCLYFILLTCLLLLVAALSTMLVRERKDHWSN